MGRDYAHKPREPERSRIPRWVYAFTLCAAAAFVGFLYFLTQVPAEGQGAEAVRQQLKAAQSSLPKPEPKVEQPAQHETIEDIKDKAEAIKQAFEFYELLEKDEVSIDLPGDTAPNTADSTNAGTGTVTETRPATVTPTVAQPVPDAQSWIIQVASFKSVADADKVRAELILSGLPNTEIVSVEVDGKGTYHRVMVGPFDSRTRLNNAQEILAGKPNYQPLVKAL